PAGIEDCRRSLGSPSEARRADIEDRGRRLGSPSEARRADIEDRGRRPPHASLACTGSEATRWAFVLLAGWKHATAAKGTARGSSSSGGWSKREIRGAEGA
ncbi:MAG: hypothetical protein ACRDJ4_07950, partial [Actinomycetota bacterium]